jgi:hypothetical protein
MADRLRLGEEPIRCKPLSKRCLPLSFVGRSVGKGSMAGVPGVGVSMSSGCSRTTLSMEVVGSILLIYRARKNRTAASDGRTCAGNKGSVDVLM